MGRELTRPSFAHVVHPDPILMERLLGLHDGVARLARTTPERFAHPEVVRSLEEALIHAMVRCLATDAGADIDARAAHHMTVISKLEEFLAANDVQSVYLSEICTATGVSESTLRRCCHEHLGMSPIRYL